MPWEPKVIVYLVKGLLPVVSVAEIVGWMSKYMDGISWNLQSLSPY